MSACLKNLFHVDFNDNCSLRPLLLLDTSPLNFCIKTAVPYFSCTTTVNMVCNYLNYVSPNQVKTNDGYIASSL